MGLQGLNHRAASNTKKQNRHKAEPADILFNRLQKIRGLAQVMAKIAAGEFINLDAKNKLFGDQKSANLNLEEQVRHFEIELIVTALIKAGGNQKRASKLLGIKATTLNAKIKRFKIPVGQTAANNLNDFLESSAS